MMQLSERLSQWFGLSYSSFAVFPRVMMENMPIEWQEKMADLCEEWDETWDTQNEVGTRVQATRGKKLVKMPEWLLNYRHPDRDKLAQIRIKDDS